MQLLFRNKNKFLVLLAILFIIFGAMVARAEDDEDENDDKPSQKTIEAIQPSSKTKVETNTKTTVLKDSDGDGLLDKDDPHPGVPEIYIVADTNNDGITDKFGSGNLVIVYPDNLVLDSDLDGLTDEGEKQLFKTNYQNPDTDNDGFLDGAEIIKGTDPTDFTSPSAQEIITNNFSNSEKETPWAWYAARTTALVGFALLYFSIFFGLSIKTPILSRIIKPIYSLEIHRWISLQALIFAIFHGASLLLDRYLNFRIWHVLIPYFPMSSEMLQKVNHDFLALGIISLYLMLILVGTSYLRKRIPFIFWRAIHFLNMGIFIVVFIHALYLGTDMKNDTVRNIFIYTNGFLAFLFLVNLLTRIAKSFKKDENIYKSHSTFFKKRSDQNFGRRV